MSNDIDTNFIHFFEPNMKKIQEAIQQYSGQHKINKQKAEIFINSQLSHLRRELAQLLIDNTTYITLEQIFSIVEQLILKLYNENNLNEKQVIYFYSGNEKKSFYFLNVIALFFIRKHNLKEPLFLKKINSTILEDETNPPIILLDDVSYSGSQLSSMINNIYYTTVVRNKKPSPNIFILLCALNDFSKYKLSNVPIKKLGPGYSEFTPSPFKLIYMEEYLFIPLISKLGIEKYVFLNLLFSFWTTDNFTPYISLYLDHKIADEVSTYTHALMYGPIPPKQISFDYFLDRDFFAFSSKIDQGIDVKSLFNEFNKANQTNFINESKDIKKMLPLLVEKFKKLDSIDKPIANNNIHFQPFIESCCENKDILMITENPSIQQMNYLMFLVPQDCFTDEPNCSVHYNFEDAGLLDFFTNDQNKLNGTKRNINLITSVKCPFSWYKQGNLTLNGETGGKKSKKRTNKKSKKRTNKKSKKRTNKKSKK
jgi:hypothetical protein